MDQDRNGSTSTYHTSDSHPVRQMSMQTDGGRSLDPRHDADTASAQSPTKDEAQQPSQHQRFALADPVAFRYLADDPSTTVLERKRDLQGYQCYLVEQWACSRRDPTFIIVSHTGNPEHKIKVGVLSVPGNEEKWSPELKMYFKALTKMHARRRDTPAGSLMVTNLSGFPSSLTLVHVPDGDPQAHREIFYVNENLKRLGCSGRAGLTVTEPSAATKAKFYQLYKVSEKIPFYSSVIELVKLAQAALMLFGFIEPEYADGILCDVTERAINDWWAEIGTSLYNVDPSDGILGPTSVSAILGTLMGARNRLNVLGAPVPKDVFDLDDTKRAISWFQKAHKVSPRTRRLDRQTLDKLHKITLKQATGEGWTIPTAVKSTMAELSGKAGEMMMDMAGRMEKVTIAEVETIDYDRFIQLVKGDRAKWLWHGKARKRGTRDMFSETLGPEVATFRDDKPESKNALVAAAGDVLKQLPRPRQLSKERDQESDVGGRSSLDLPDDSEKRRSNVIDKAKGKIKGARHRRHGAEQTHNQEGMYETTNNQSMESLSSNGTGPPEASPTEHEGRVAGFFERKKDGLRAHHKHTTRTSNSKDASHPSTASSSHRGSTVDSSNPQAQAQAQAQADLERLPAKLPFDFAEEILPATSLTTLHHSTTSTSTNYQPLSELPRPRLQHVHIKDEIGFYLRHRHSYSEYESRTLSPGQPHEAHWPRHGSFSVAETTLTTKPTRIDANIDAIHPPDPDTTDAPAVADPTIYPSAKSDLQSQLQLSHQLSNARTSLSHLTTSHLPHLTTLLTSITLLHTQASEDITQLSSLTQPRKEDFHALHDATTALTGQERHQLEQAVREVEEAVKKVEYEIRALEGKVGDAEGAVAEFERRVGFVEGRVGELVRGRKGEREEGWARRWGREVWTWVGEVVGGRVSGGQ